MLYTPRGTAEQFPLLSPPPLIVRDMVQGFQDLEDSSHGKHYNLGNEYTLFEKIYPAAVVHGLSCSET